MACVLLSCVMGGGGQKHNRVCTIFLSPRVFNSRQQDRISRGEGTFWKNQHEIAVAAVSILSSSLRHDGRGMRSTFVFEIQPTSSGAIAVRTVVRPAFERLTQSCPVVAQLTDDFLKETAGP